MERLVSLHIDLKLVLFWEENINHLKDNNVLLLGLQGMVPICSYRNLYTCINVAIPGDFRGTAAKVNVLMNKLKYKACLEFIHYYQKECSKCAYWSITGFPVYKPYFE
jgi:hypothetical protein